MAKSKKIVVANWKMNPPTIDEAVDLFDGIKKKTQSIRGVSTIICPPFVYLAEFSAIYRGNKIAFGAQDVFWEEKGSYTGEISPSQLKSVDVSYVIIGHSERRALGESNADVAIKVRAALKAGLSVIVCVGEGERDTHAAYLSFIKEELYTALKHVSKKELARVIVAYEPIWAIGKSAKDAMQPGDVHEMSLFIKKLLSEKYDTKTASSVPILYGGSAEPSNVEAILERKAVNGFLVGHASLNPESFAAIVKSTSVS